MKKLIAVVMLLSLSVCAISSCEDQTEEFDVIDSTSQQIEHEKMPVEDEGNGSEHEPDAP